MSHTTEVVDREEVPQQSALGLGGGCSSGRDVRRRAAAPPPRATCPGRCPGSLCFVQAQDCSGTFFWSTTSVVCGTVRAEVVDREEVPQQSALGLGGGYTSGRDVRRRAAASRNVPRALPRQLVFRPSPGLLRYILLVDHLSGVRHRTRGRAPRAAEPPQRYVYVMTTRSLPESFDDAVREFRAFLRGQGHFGPVVWLFADDVSSRGVSTWVRWPLPATNSDRVATLYSMAHSGEGVRMEGWCRVGSKVCATVSLPRHDDAATGRLCSGLMLSVGTPLRLAQPVRSRLRWAWLRWRNGVPSRTGVAAFVAGDS
ncbi:hypothetical protein Pla163_06120 [Planctomycetes bacterium Pla163]|uniref:Uncharacterized protein n=1 Tax=Rohdeia mirabilis TaxID=2528008 RepID=A0A518CWC5_9BACT|nr:hypothetical protein Pla163_06120 [Planctomycetes bacterium Pla163]